MEVIGPVELSVEATVVWHHLLGPQHALVRNKFIATMTKLIHKTLRGPVCGRIVTRYHSAIGVQLNKGMKLLVSCGVEVGIVEGCTQGIDVGSQYCRVGVRNRCQ